MPARRPRQTIVKSFRDAQLVASGITAISGYDLYKVDYGVIPSPAGSMFDQGYVLTDAPMPVVRKAAKMHKVEIPYQPRRNPQERRSARRMGAKKNPGLRGRGEISGAFRFLPESIKIRKNGGTVEQIKYQDANDQKHYVHDFEDLGAFMYLCDSALGKCLLIVPGDGATPLWEPI